METRAYDEMYLYYAQNILGHAVDFAVMTLDVRPDLFAAAFIVSESSKQFAKGNPAYVAGINGCELARRVLSETGMAYEDKEDVMYLDKSPEYWAGWALAFYQWYSSYSFMQILSAVSLDDIISMYPKYHEMDITQFAEALDKRMREAQHITRLKYYRENCGLSQSDLAEHSGVPLRQIQLFEQRQRDINKTAADTLQRLSRSLQCSMEDLLER